MLSLVELPSRNLYPNHNANKDKGKSEMPQRETIEQTKSPLVTGLKVGYFDATTHIPDRL